jgi:uncharacterized protein YjbJ (UPF0337 family)
VAVEKGTRAVISVDFSVCGERTFNNLRANFAGEIPRKEFFNTHTRCRSLTSGQNVLSSVERSRWRDGRYRVLAARLFSQISWFLKLANQGVADQAKGAAKETWGNAKDAVKEVQQSRKDTATGKAHETRGKISQSVQDAKEKINEKIEELKEGYSS